MRHASLIPLAALLIAAQQPAKPSTPSEIVAAAPASAWRPIRADDLLVIDLASGGRLVVQLAPAFTPVHVANVKALARSNYWDGATVYRVQDNYVAQWGNNESEKPWPQGVNAKPPSEYTRPLKGLKVTALGSPDPYAPGAGFAEGWPIAYSAQAGWAALAHCYGTVGIGRGLEDSGTGGELYAIIGHAPRHMDRNLAVVGRVVEGIERLSSLPRGTEALGFYKDKAQFVPVRSIRLASQMEAGEQPLFEYLDTASGTFGEYLRVRSHRKDDFYRQPADGVDLCNVQVPVRRKPAGEQG